MIYIYLSYSFKNLQPIYGDRANINIKAVKSILKEDSSNVYEFTLQNHWGTHIDAPAHFFKNGKRIADYPTDFWIFSNPEVIEVRLNPREILMLNESFNNIKNKVDLLLIKSGWYAFRDEDIYVYENPGIHPEVGFYLRERFPNLKAVGIDWISISSYVDRELGREAHRAFLNPDGINNPVLIIEDMNLSKDLNRLSAVWAFPLIIDEIDSAPCTVVGVLE